MDAVFQFHGATAEIPAEENPERIRNQWTKTKAEEEEGEGKDLKTITVKWPDKLLADAMRVRR